MMKRILVTILTLTVFAGFASATTISADKLKQDIQNIIIKDFSSKTNAEIDVKITMLPFQSITLPDGEVTYALVNQNDELNLISRQVKRINILVDNKLQRTINVPIELKAFEEVLVASNVISREQPINPTNTTIKKINISDKANFIITKNDINKEMVAKRDYRDGEYIDKRFIKVKPDVTKNSEVRIILNSGNGLQIAIDGIARADGIIGEYVTVENKMYNKTYSAKVIGENRVLVNI